MRCNCRSDQQYNNSWIVCVKQSPPRHQWWSLFDDVSEWGTDVQSGPVELRESVEDPIENVAVTAPKLHKGRVETGNRLDTGRCLIFGIFSVMRGRLRIHRHLPAPAGQEA